MALFEIRRSTPGTVSGTLPATAYPRGTPLKISAVNADTGARTFVIAAGKADGFMTRDSRAAVDGSVRTDEEHLFPNAAFEAPFLVSAEGTIETEVTELVVEGDLYIKDASTGAITISTAAGTKLSFEAGLFYEAAEGDLAQWELVAQLTREDTANTCRIHVKKIQGYLVPAPAV